MAMARQFDCNVSTAIQSNSIFRHFSTDCSGTIFAVGCLRRGPVKDLHTVLRQKQQDVERVRREIHALLTVIPLLADDQPSSDDVAFLTRLASARRAEEPFDNGMADLETYYPFVKHMRKPEPK
jgi:hypothetical protein